MNRGQEQQPKRLDDQSLVEGYRRGEVSGEAVIDRLLEKIDMGSRSQETLMRQDGTFLTDDEGRPLRAVDYMAVADKHGATDIILHIVAMPETDPRFPDAKKAISSVVNGYLPPEPAG